VLWLVPGLALTKSKINSGELTDKYRRMDLMAWKPNPQDSVFLQCFDTLS